MPETYVLVYLVVAFILLICSALYNRIKKVNGPEVEIGVLIAFAWPLSLFALLIAGLGYLYCLISGFNVSSNQQKIRIENSAQDDLLKEAEFEVEKLLGEK